MIILKKYNYRTIGLTQSYSSDMLNREQIISLYQQYCVNPDDIAKLAMDLEIDPDGILFLAISWKFKAKTIGEFTIDEWTNGMKNVFKTDNLVKFKHELEKIEIELAVPEIFREFYLYIYETMLTDEYQKVILKDLAIVLWSSILKDKCSFLDKWIEFLEQNDKIKVISKDLWDMFLMFCVETDGDFMNYDFDAWPNTIDQFVEWVKR